MLVVELFAGVRINGDVRSGGFRAVVTLYGPVVLQFPLASQDVTL